MFVAAVGVGIIASHRDHDDHYNHSKYNAAALVREIEEKTNRYKQQLDSYAQREANLKSEFNTRLQQFQNERLVNALSGAEFLDDFDNLFRKARTEVINNIDSELAEENQQLEQIDNMIARINQIALQETGGNR